MPQQRDDDALRIHLAFLGLLVLSIALFRERLYADSAYYAARVILSEGFWVEHSRIILVFSQWLPLLAIKLHLPLRVVLIAYSVGHVLFFYLLFIGLHTGLKHREAGYFLLLLQTMGILHGYFTPMFELYYGAGLLVAFWVVLANKALRGAWLAWLLVLALLILLSHPMCLLLLLFVLVFHALMQGPCNWRVYLALGALMLAVVIFKSQTASAYEQGKSQAFAHTLTSGEFVYLFRPDYLRGLGAFLLRYYFDLLFCLLLSLGLLLRRRKRLPAALLALAFVGLLAMVNVSHRGFAHTRYQEQVYFPLIVVVAGACIMGCMPLLNTVWRRRMALAVFALVFIRLALIAQSSGDFTRRIEYMQSLIQAASTQPGSKCWLPAAAWDPAVMEPNWSLPIETLLLSGLEGPAHALTLCTDQDLDFEGNRDRLREDRFLFRRWDILPDSAANARYFHLERGGYRPCRE